MKTSIVIALALCASVMSCDKDKPSTPTTATSAAATTAAPSSSVAAASDVPTEEDFEDEAEQKITPENADQELDKLEKEISN